MTTVLVVGGGFAGLAAAWELNRQGIAVSVLHAGAGASALYSGALDRSPEVDGSERGALPSALLGFLSHFGRWFHVKATEPLWVPTATGQVRLARAADRAVLDLSDLGGRPVAVLDLGRPGWDAEFLAQSLAASPLLRSRRAVVKALKVAAPDPRAFLYLSDQDLCDLWDDPDFQSAIARRIGALVTADVAFLAGPWLGTRGDAAERLSEALGRPFGETLSEPGGPAGRRFEWLRQEWFNEARLPVHEGKLGRLLPTGGSRGEAGWRVSMTPVGGMSETELGPFDWVVLATGGLVGGGIQFQAHSEQRHPAGFSLSYEAPIDLCLPGYDPLAGGAVEGADLTALGIESLERVGAVAPRGKTGRAERLVLAGAALAARPRTALEAIESGVSAARQVLAQAGGAGRPVTASPAGSS